MGEQRKADKNYIFRMMFIVLFDLLIAIIVPMAALVISYNFDMEAIPYELVYALAQAAPFFVVLSIAVYYIAHLYSVIWTYISIDILYRIIGADLFILAVQFVYLHMKHLSYPLSFYILETLILMLATAVNRFFYRFVVRFLKSRLSAHSAVLPKRRALLVGAGEAGLMLIKESKSNPDFDLRFVGAIDDNSSKVGRYLNGVKVVGDRSSISMMADRLRVDVIVLAIPSASKAEQMDILSHCKTSRRQILIMPSVSQMVHTPDAELRTVEGHELRSINVEDLLGREPVKENVEALVKDIGGKRILITGGGGSIGSELSRQIASLGPALLILFDIYENGVYDLQNELKRDFPYLNLLVLIGSVRDLHRVETVFAAYRPELIYHAAAHKHVPLMEASPNEVIKNNVHGTLHVAKMAAKYKAKRFVLISTDKAVNPTNIMGASKRICEMIIQDLNGQNLGTEFVAVRFGNVLGSSGSVIPLFQKQIEAGGPVTVTHPDIIRYFMTIPEAANLVLQAGAYAKGGEIFVLDMGEPVRIVDLAKNLIYLAGLEPDKDIQIVFTGLRPGEKLYEEMLMSEEGLATTPNKKIFIGHPLEIDHETFCRELDELINLSYQDGSEIRKAVAHLLPSYQCPQEPEMP